MASQKAQDGLRRVRRENCLAEVLAKIDVQIKFGAIRFDQQLAGTVVKKEGNVQGFFGDFLPLA